MGWDNDDYYDIPYHGDSGYTGHGSDDGYDAIKDANLEAGLGPRNAYGIGEAAKRGWIKKKPKAKENESPNGQSK